MGVISIILIIIINLAMVGEIKSLIQCETMDHDHKMNHILIFSIFIALSAFGLSEVLNFMEYLNNHFIPLFMYFIGLLFMLLHLREERLDIKERVSISGIFTIILKKINKIWN